MMKSIYKNDLHRRIGGIRLKRLFFRCFAGLFVLCLSSCSWSSVPVEGTQRTDSFSSIQIKESMISEDATSHSGIVSVVSYGAVGDGITDDTDAIQSAVSSDDIIYFPPGEYLISKPILITDKKYWSMYAQDAVFNYSGSDYAFMINAAENCQVNIGTIRTENGGGIKFYSENPRKWNQYVRLSFNYIECFTDCIYIMVSGGWCNENQIYGGRFAGGNNGVRIDYLANDVINGWKFYNCGIEGVDNGFLFDAGKGSILDMSIINARHAEAYKTILKTKGIVRDCLWIGTYTVNRDIISCSKKTNRFEILAPIGEKGHRGCIVDGILMIEKVEYEGAA